MSFQCKIYIYLIIQIFSLFACSEPTFLCDPATDCSSREAGDKVPDPDNCHNYYLCIQSGDEIVPSDHYLICEVGMYFDHDAAICKAETGTCVKSCIKNYCKTECVVDLDLIPDHINGCSNYFICVGGDKLPIVCPDPNPYFNGTGCSPNVCECCDACDPYCFMANTEVQDPYDCTMYYICTADNTTPNETMHFTCSSGGFNPTTGVCDPSLTYCTPVCEGVTPSTTTATTELPYT